MFPYKNIRIHSFWDLSEGFIEVFLNLSGVFIKSFHTKQILKYLPNLTEDFVSADFTKSP